METLLIAVGLFLSALAAHVIIWRVRIPRNQTRCLLLIFALTPLFLCAAAAATRSSIPMRPFFPGDVPGIALFYLGAVGCYLITYAGVEETSPSLKLIRALEAAAEDGCTRGDLAKLITEEHFVEPRLRALKRQGIIAETAEGNTLTGRGTLIARSAALLSAIFRIDEGV
jgi:hypothetical protein